MTANANSNPSSLEAFPAFKYVPQADNTPAIVATSSPKPAERPIRFPHIPSLNQSPPGASQYVLLNQRELRIDRPHHPVVPLGVEVRKSEPESSDAAPAVPVQAPSTTVPTKTQAAVPQNRFGSGIPAAQIEQIADYLRKKRNELESEQTDLQLTALKQQTELWQEKEQLREQQLNIQMVQATLEILRRQLLDFGEALSVAAGSNDTLSSRFEAVCQAYFDAAQIAKLLDSGA